MLSGVVAIAFSALCYTGAVPTEGFPLAAFLVCLGIGLAYLAIGVVIAAVGGRKAGG